ncbi:MAG: peptide chain release factor N(5)-glutamine methyltransferase, partial [Candidatus Falkowbacteria bacterium]|nr:peptide chain release factor N(5)-glutamine methyltransferase [Candidatus Falkowbacteria bacterium]
CVKNYVILTIMIIKNQIKSQIEKLKVNPLITYPQLEAEILLAHILQKPREYLFSYSEKSLTKNQIARLNNLIDKRIKGEPIAYLIGKKEFYGLTFLVNKHTLIPRPETELLIDEYKKIALNYLNHQQVFSTIDIGTGTGCIIIACAQLLKSHSGKNNLSFIASDISQQALLVAQKNAKLHKINKIKFINGDLLKPILNSKNTKLKENIIITANLPYLTPSQVKNSPSIQSEPKSALVAGADGLKYYKALFSQIKKLIELSKPNSMTLLCEIDPTQTQKISEVLCQALPQAKFAIKKDLLIKDRLVIIKIK